MEKFLEPYGKYPVKSLLSVFVGCPSLGSSDSRLDTASHGSPYQKIGDGGRITKSFKDKVDQSVCTFHFDDHGGGERYK